MKITLTPEQVEQLIQKEKEVLTIQKEKAIASIEKQFDASVAKLVGKYKTVEVAITTDEFAAPEVDDKESEYLKKSRSINAKLTKARKAGNAIDVEKYEAERTALNIQFGKKSRK